MHYCVQLFVNTLVPQSIANLSQWVRDCDSIQFLIVQFVIFNGGKIKLKSGN